MNILRPQQIMRVLDITDQVGIHREAIRVPLTPVPGGDVRIEGKAAVIELPSDGGVDAFLAALPDRLRSQDGFDKLMKADDMSL